MTEYFTSIKSVLNGAAFNAAHSDYAKIIENWTEIVGKKFAAKSEIAEIYQKAGQSYILVHTSSSALAQELCFFKNSIIKKIFDKYNIIICDLIIKPSSKLASPEEIAKENEVLEIYSERPSEKELKAIVLDELTLKKLTASINKQKTLTPEQKQRMLEVVSNDLKTQEWMKQKGFPVCKKCGRVMTQKKFGEECICNICKHLKGEN